MTSAFIIDMGKNLGLCNSMQSMWSYFLQSNVCVIQMSLVNHSVPQFPHLLSRDDKTDLTRLL